jgi:two-component system, cell cycle response regulator
MRVLLAHALTPKRRRFARVLEAAGHAVSEAGDPVEALERCRAWAPDVALIHVECCGDLVCAIKGDPVAYGTAILMIERPGLTPEQAAEGMRSGVQDYLIEPVSDGEVLTRVTAAARTKELQLELVAQGARLEALLREDALTGLSNRRAILTQLGGMVSAARRHGHPLSIAVLDLDHFKRINDSHGHLAGDTVLHAVATAMRGEVRDQDLVGRFGGEEFVMLLPRPESLTYAYEELRGIADRIRRSVAGLAVVIPTPDGPLTIGDVSVSIGGAIFPEDGTQVQDLVAVADTALYAAKRAGRNRIERATPKGRVKEQI